MGAELAIALLIVWNIGFIFQWGTNMIPNRGPISWKTMAYNQVAVVPVQIFDTAKRYLVARGALMEQLEQEDIQEIRSPKLREEDN